MDSDKIFALLDADFIIKTMIAQKDTCNRLLDWLVSNSHYQFVCHDMAMQEISKHDNCGAVPWLSNAVGDGRVILYTDQDIVTELYSFIGAAGIQMYKDFLKISCESMSATFYTQYYSIVDAFDPEGGVTAFMNVLQQCDAAVGSSNSLGERKAMILLQWLLYFHPNKVYMFCSDDRKARAGLYAVTSVPCKSVMTIFWDMKKQGVNKNESYQYFYPLEQFMTQYGKTTGNIRVLEAKSNNQIAIPCKQIFDEIFDGKYNSLKTGFLRYKA